MTEHMWKKLGEVKAFALAAVDFFERGKSGFLGARVFSENEVTRFIESNKKQIEKIDEIAGKAEETETVDGKAKATGDKLSDMQGRYLQNEDDWKDEMELLEWSGFFFGGAVIHWSVIAGASESVKDADLTGLAESGLSFYTELFNTAKESISKLAEWESANE